MALAAATVFEIQSSATAGNVNGGGFNPANAGMLTDLTTDANTANTSAPVVSSVSYNFVAGDVGNWLYIKSGTSWTVGWYKIASVASNKATLSAAVGSASVMQVVNNRYGTNTVIGCATVGTPISGTFTIDYSQSAACITSTSVSDYASAISSTTMTSATAAFTPVMVGNLFHLNNAGTGGFGIVGWYEIATYVNATTVTTDRTTNSGTAMVNGQGKVGGALSLGSSDDAVFELAVSSATASARYFIQGNATYTLGGTVTIAASGNSTWPIIIEGYTSSRGDRPVGSTRPILACGAGTFTLGGISWFMNLQMTGTAAAILATNGSDKIFAVKITNSSTTANRAGLTTNSGTATHAFYCELISYRGYGSQCNTGGYFNCYIHDCGVNGIFGVGANCTVINCIFASNVSNCFSSNTAINISNYFINNTFYGAENKIGQGLNFITGTTLVNVVNNIFYGFTAAVVHADTQVTGYDDFNNYFNNTADVSAAAQWQKGANDTAIAPSFTNVTQALGSTATTTAGNHLVQSGATFQTSGVVAGRDFLYVVSGTGVTAGVYGIASVDSETQITTDIAIAADATADKVWRITVGRNFAVGTAAKALGYPGVFPGGLTTGYMDQGAIQRQEVGIIASRIFTGY